MSILVLSSLGLSSLFCHNPESDIRLVHDTCTMVLGGIVRYGPYSDCCLALTSGILGLDLGRRESVEDKQRGSQKSPSLVYQRRRACACMSPIQGVVVSTRGRAKFG